MFARTLLAGAISAALLSASLCPAEPPPKTQTAAPGQTPRARAATTPSRAAARPDRVRLLSLPAQEVSATSGGTAAPARSRPARHRHHHRRAGRRGWYPPPGGENVPYPYDYAPYGYPYGYGYGYGGPYSPDQWRRYWDNRYWAWRHYDRLERQHRFNVRDMRRRRRKLIGRHAEVLAAGLERLRAGQTARAVAALSLAAELDQGDPACRIHLAQARLELGHYERAAKALRSALRLQPKLAYADLHLDSYYATPGTLAARTDRLRAYLASRPAPPDVYFLLGFLEYQRGHLDAAHAAFGHVAAARPNDELTRTLLELTTPAEP